MKLNKFFKKMILTLISSSMLISSNLNAALLDTLSELPENIFQAVWVTACYSLIIPVYFASLVYDGDRDVSKDKRFKHLLYKTYTLKEKWVYHQFGSNSELDPNKVGFFWIDWGEERCKPFLVEAGTRVTIYKILEHKGTGLLSGYQMKVIAVIEDGAFSGYMVDIGDFLAYERADSKNLRIMDSSKLE